MQTKKNAKDKIYQIKITLKNSKPAIWRRVLVPPDILLPDLHEIIQTVMDWGDWHLHQFAKGRSLYSVQDEEDSFMGFETVGYSKIKLSDLLKKEKEKIQYEYDFGDGWEHVITLEKIIDRKEDQDIPICTAGKNSTPPEDTGGIWRYRAFLEIRKNPDHEEYEEYLDLYGDDFDPEYFDIDEINDSLQ